MPKKLKYTTNVVSNVTPLYKGVPRFLVIKRNSVASIKLLTKANTEAM